MTEDGKASLAEGLQIHLVPLLLQQILHAATLLTNEMVMRHKPRIIARHPLAQQHQANFSLVDQPLQVAIHRPQTNMGQGLTHALKDRIRAGVRVIALQRLIDRG
jgi:hypothetical protein